jgi:hypothetical protein
LLIEAHRRAHAEFDEAALAADRNNTSPEAIAARQAIAQLGMDVAQRYDETNDAEFEAQVALVSIEPTTIEGRDRASEVRRQHRMVWRSRLAGISLMGTAVLPACRRRAVQDRGALISAHRYRQGVAVQVGARRRWMALARPVATNSRWLRY